MAKYTKLVRDALSRYKWQSLFVRNLKKYILLIFIPLMILLLIVYYVCRINIMNDLINGIDININTNENLVQDMLEECQNFYDVISIDDPLRNFCTMSDFDYSNLNDIKVINDLSSMLSKHMAVMNSIDGIIVYSEKNNCIVSNYGNENLEKFVYSDRVKNKIGAYKPYYQIYKGDAESCIDFIYKISLESNYDNYIIITLNVDEAINNAEMSSIENIFLEYNNEIVYSKNRNYTVPKEEKRYEKLSRKNITFFNRDDILVERGLNGYNIKLIMQITGEIFKSYDKVLRITFVLCIAVIMLLSILLSFVMSMQYYNSISNIVMLCQKNLMEYDMGSDEIELISSSINNLSNKLSNTEEQLASQIIDLQRAQILIMQNQINPHFLFNTLNAINVLIIDESGEDSTSVMLIEKLSEMLSALLNTKTNMITTEEELNYTQTYIDIESIKHMNSFDVAWSVQDDLKQQMIPKMILQPIVENALNHGVYKLPKSKRGKIVINIYSNNENINFDISDNGTGLDIDKLYKINNDLSMGVVPEPRHIGLLNVNIRIRTMYGDRYGCSIVSDENGTTVKIIIPRL